LHVEWSAALKLAQCAGDVDRARCRHVSAHALGGLTESAPSRSPLTAGRAHRSLGPRARASRPGPKARPERGRVRGRFGRRALRRAPAGAIPPAPRAAVSGRSLTLTAGAGPGPGASHRAVTGRGRLALGRRRARGPRRRRSSPSPGCTCPPCTSASPRRPTGISSPGGSRTPDSRCPRPRGGP